MNEVLEELKQLNQNLKLMQNKKDDLLSRKEVEVH